LLFKSGAQMEDLFDRILDRTRSRLDIRAIRTIFGLKTRPHRTREDGPPAQEIVIEKPRYGLSWFRISFGRLQLKAYTTGEHVLLRGHRPQRQGTALPPEPGVLRPDHHPAGGHG
jgi:hypothetical protein